MVRDGKRGVYNFTNPGTMSHNEIMGMYRDIVDPTFTWKNFSVRKAKFMTVFFTCFFFFFLFSGGGAKQDCACQAKQQLFGHVQAGTRVSAGQVCKRSASRVFALGQEEY
jgi:hypothetical protein